MSIDTIWNSVKSLYPDYVIFIKIGKFYSVYNQDAYIISYELNYKLKNST